MSENENKSSIPPMYGNPSFPQSEPQTAPEPETAPLPPRDIPFKDFLKFFDPKQRKGITGTAVLCYVCAALTIVVALLGEPLGAIDGIILLALALGLHIGKSRVCAVGILVLAIVEFLVALITTGIPNGWLWVLAGVLAVLFTFRARKNYRTFQETGALPPQ